MAKHAKSNALDEQLARAAGESEAGYGGPDASHDGAGLPAHVTVTRGHPGTTVLPVRLDDVELAALERIAAERELPVSTVAREQLLRLIADDATNR